MKLWTMTLGVCLLSWSNSWAQASAFHDSTPALTGHWDAGLVTSVQRLKHVSNKHALQLELKGMQEYARDQYEKALLLLSEAIAIDPRSARFYNNQGVVYCALGRDQEAQKSFQNAIDNDPSDAVSYVNLSAVAFNTYQYGLAEGSARRALRLAPRNTRAKLMLAVSEVAQNQWTNEARRLLEENRNSFAQAEKILRAWPEPNPLTGGSRRITVHGPGPGAFQKSFLKNSGANP